MAIPPGMGQNQRQFCDALKEEIKRELDTERKYEMTGAIRTWGDCSVCQEVLDGEANGMVALSKRCHHVFHKTCIEGWLEQGHRKCPNCQLEYFSKYEVVPNPENTVQYRKWFADPEGYTYEKAFQEEYGKPYSLEDAGFPAEHIVRPVELRGQERRERLTKEEIFSFYKEMVAAVMELGGNATREQIDKAKRECDEAEALILESIGGDLNAIREDFAELRRQNVRQFAALDELGKHSDHQALLSGYYRKVDALEKKINARLSALRALPYRDDQQFALTRELSDFFRALSPFDTRFRLDGRIDERSIEDSQALLKQVDTELDAFLEEQPEHIKAILNAPLPEVRPPVAPPEIPPNGRMKRGAYLCLFLVAGIAVDVLCKHGIPPAFKFWDGKSIKPLPKSLDNQFCS